jgi:predicted metalloprotease with PDZ domain
MHLRHVALLLPLLSLTAAHAQELRATISMEDPQRHFLHIELRLSGFAEEELLVALPVWTPGSYKVRDYAQYVESVEASDGSGAPLEIHKVGKSRWAIQRGGAYEVVMRYDAFAFERSVRQCFLDDTHAFLTLSAILPYVEGHLELPYVVEIVPPRDDWRVDTSLAAIGERTYRATNYDQLVDSPLQVGTQEVFPFDVDGTAFALVVTGEGNLDGVAMTDDIAKVVEVTGEIFGGFPFDRYLFLLRLGQGGGGLEHLESTALMSSPWRFDSESGWQDLLGLVAHEFFHAWNVKRIRDEALGPFDYSKEVYTELLWMHEGWTSYYSPVLLTRAGIKDEKDLLKSFSSTVSSYLNRPGRRIQSLAASSYDAWIKHYQTSATTRNSTVDYYSQGSAAALCLDLIVRHHSAAEHSLDDVLRALWDEHAVAARPINPDIVRTTLVRLGGAEAQSFWTHHVEGTEEIDFAHFLSYAGIDLKLKRDGDKSEEEDDEEDDEEDEDSDDDKDENEDAPWDHGVTPDLDWSTSTSGRSVTVRSLERDGVAWRAGFAMGDELLAIGERRITTSTWSKLLLAHRDAGVVEILIARGERLMRLALPLDGRKLKASLKKMKAADELQQEVYEGLFGKPFEKPKPKQEDSDDADAEEQEAETEPR